MQVIITLEDRRLVVIEDDDFDIHEDDGRLTIFAFSDDKTQVGKAVAIFNKGSWLSVVIHGARR